MTETVSEEMLLLAAAGRRITRQPYSLEIHLRVPVAIEEDDCVGSSQVDTDTTGSRAEQEEMGRLWSGLLIEVLEFYDTTENRNIPVGREH